MFLALVLFLIIAVFYVLFTPDYFSDNRYNLGVARRSALPEARWPLETSLAHLLFKPDPIVRPEDWHRGLSVFLLAQWARFFSAIEWAMRLPHLVWVAMWWGITVLLLRCLSPRSNVFPMLLFCVFTFLILESRWHVLKRAFLDDVPSTVFILVGVYVFIREEILTLRSAALIGALCALGAFCKDMNLVWAGIGLILILSRWRLEKRAWADRQLYRQLAAFIVGFGVIILPRFLWSYTDFGELLHNPIQHWITTGTFGEFPIAPYLPYFVIGDTSYLSRVALAGSVQEMLWRMVTRAFIPTLWVLFSFAFIWFGLLLARGVAQVIHRKGILTAERQRLALACVVSTTLLLFFLGVGFGEGAQLRYWLIPATLGIVLLTAIWADLLKVVRQRLASHFPIVASAALIVYLFAVNPQWHFPGQWLSGDVSGLTPVLLNGIADHVQTGESVMMNPQEAMHYWSVNPQDHVLAYSAVVLSRLDTEVTSAVIDFYDVRYAVYWPLSAEDQAKLETLGFREIFTVDNRTLYERLLLPSAAS